MRPDFDTNDIEPTGPERVPHCAICGDEADQALNNVELCADHFRRELTARSVVLQRLEGLQ
jgi:hypothetical protein